MAEINQNTQEINGENFTFKQASNFLQEIYNHFPAELYRLTFVDMGKVTEIPQRRSITEGAYPCLAGAAIRSDKKGIYVFHFLGTEPPESLIRLAKHNIVKGGIAGGSKEAYEFKANASFLEKAGIQYIPPETLDRSMFSVLSLPEVKTVLYSYSQQH
jgi:hypothetical protein